MEMDKRGKERTQKMVEIVTYRWNDNVMVEEEVLQ